MSIARPHGLSGSRIQSFVGDSISSKRFSHQPIVVVGDDALARFGHVRCQGWPPAAVRPRLAVKEQAASAGVARHLAADQRVDDVRDRVRDVDRQRRLDWRRLRRVVNPAHPPERCRAARPDARPPLFAAVPHHENGFACPIAVGTWDTASNFVSFSSQLAPNTMPPNTAAATIHVPLGRIRVVRSAASRSESSEMRPAFPTSSVRTSLIAARAADKSPLRMASRATAS